MKAAQVAAWPPVALRCDLPEVPRWLAATAAALGDIGVRSSVRAGGAAGDPPGTIEWTSQTQVAEAPAAGETWFVGGVGGQPLDPRFPLLADVCAGQGMAVQLWTRSTAAPAWRLLRRAHVAADRGYAAALAELPLLLARLLEQALTDRVLGAAPPPGPALARLPAAAVTPRWPQGARLADAWRRWWNRQRARWLSEYWQIGVVDAPVARLLETGTVPAVRWITRADGASYLADPAAALRQPEHIWCERYDHGSGLGRIACLEVDASGRVGRERLLPVGGGSHASFPQLFECGGRLLALAETGGVRRCVLHEVDRNGDWHPLCDVLRGVAAVDPTLFEWQGRYWLAFTDADQGSCDNLCLYFAERPEGPWRAHANNPVLRDVRGARMAGALFRHGDALIRPAQDCLPTYGAAVVLQRVLVCTPQDYAEETAGRLAPDPRGPCPDGLHTVSAWGARTLIDGKRHALSLPALRRKLRARVIRSAEPGPDTRIFTP